MTWTKIREKLAMIFTLILIFVVFCAVSVSAGWQIPGITQAAQFLGFAN